ncbi:ThiF family adenylyltransferase [Falsihalocynthiibacter sp. S25ZX9]|uniref:HesA/MoeB/ThiF family protein n=1 Tax=Falsihalocynthiibacter sp. S25ZX9 TaxID=3240870 RepID=UPI0035103AEB
MIFPLFLMAAIWFGGGYLKAPRSLRGLLIFCIYVVGLLAHFALPEGNAMRGYFGQVWGEWALVGMLIGSVFGFQRWILWLRHKVAENAETLGPNAIFRDVEIDRYSRHIFLREIGGAGQKRLRDAKVLVIGAGGLGAPVLQYLAAAGVGTIGIVDDDVVDNSNLQRQVIHKDASIDMPKVFSAEQELRAQNPFVEIRPYFRRLDREGAVELFAEYDVIMDGTDNFETRYMVNEVAVLLRKPLISAAMTQWEGQISIYDPARGGPCYQCVFPEIPAPGLVPNCAEAGVVGPLPGIIGSLMALEAVKEITGAGEGLRGQLLMYDGLYAQARKISVKRREDCPICGENSH